MQPGSVLLEVQTGVCCQTFLPDYIAETAPRTAFLEGWPSGLRRTLGKRVYGKPYRGFEPHSLRSCTKGAEATWPKPMSYLTFAAKSILFQRCSTNCEAFLEFHAATRNILPISTTIVFCSGRSIKREGKFCVKPR